MEGLATSLATIGVALVIAVITGVTKALIQARRDIDRLQYQIDEAFHKIRHGSQTRPSKPGVREYE
jgi:low affinity Fe/Cu permease